MIKTHSMINANKTELILQKLKNMVFKEYNKEVKYTPLIVPSYQIKKEYILIYDLIRDAEKYDDKIDVSNKMLLIAKDEIDKLIESRK